MVTKRRGDDSGDGPAHRTLLQKVRLPHKSRLRFRNPLSHFDNRSVGKRIGAVVDIASTCERQRHPIGQTAREPTGPAAANSYSWCRPTVGPPRRLDRFSGRHVDCRMRLAGLVIGMMMACVWAFWPTAGMVYIPENRVGGLRQVDLALRLDNRGRRTNGAG